MPGTLRCYVHKAYFGKVATTMPRNSCMRCWRVHEEEMNTLLARFGWKASLVLEAIKTEDMAVHGKGAQGMLVQHDSSTEMREPQLQTVPLEQLKVDPLEGVPPVTEEVDPPESFVVPAGSIALKPFPTEPGKILHQIVVPEPVEVATPAPAEVAVPADPDPITEADATAEYVTEIPVLVPGVIGNADGSSPGQKEQADSRVSLPGVPPLPGVPVVEEHPAPGIDSFPQGPPVVREPETPPDDVPQLDESVESVIQDLLRGDGGGN